MQKRVQEIDSIRALAILSVILIHVSGAYVANSSIAYYLNQLARYAVPVFVILSGFSLYYTDMNRPHEPYLTFYAKRLKKVLIPYIIWSLLFVLYNQAITGKLSNLIAILKTLLFGQASYHLYFIIIIMQLYLLYPLLRALFQKHFKIILTLSFIITLYYQTQIYLSAMKIRLPILHIVFDNYMVLFTWIFYFALGMFFAMRLEQLKAFLKHKVLISIIWVLSFALLIIDSKLTKTFELSIKPSIMLYSVISFLMLYLLCTWINSVIPAIEKGLLWVSENSFFIYFSHAMLLSATIRYIKPSPAGPIISGRAGVIILYIFTCFITFLLAAIATRMPFKGYLGCKASKPKVSSISKG